MYRNAACNGNAMVRCWIMDNIIRVGVLYCPWLDECPRWAEPRRHTLDHSSIYGSVSESFREIDVRIFSAIAENIKA